MSWKGILFSLAGQWKTIAVPVTFLAAAHLLSYAPPFAGRYYPPFIVAVTLTALFYGMLPALAATAGSMALIMLVMGDTDVHRPVAIPHLSFLFSCLIIVWVSYRERLTMQRLEALRRAERETYKYQRDEIFRMSVAMAVKIIRDSLTSIIGYAELSLTADSEALSGIRAAVARADQSLEEVQVLAAEQKK